MTSEVGSGSVAIFPTFKGFRKAIEGESGKSAKAAGDRFRTGFKSAGTDSGKAFASGLRAASSDVASASRAVAASRLKEQDAIGRVRVAEAALSAARGKFAADSVQVIRADERLQSQQRALAAAESATAGATQRLTSAKRALEVATAGAGAAAGAADGRFSRLGSTFESVGNSVGTRFSTGFGAVLGGSIGANIITGAASFVGREVAEGARSGFSAAFQGVQLASDLSETTSAVRTVFGDAAGEILSFTKTANTALGQTQQQALTGAQTFGVFAKSAGLTGRPLAKFSTGLVTLSGDLASFYNTSPEDALEAISAGLRGEAEPLRKYGVLLSDAALKHRALELGIYSGNGALNQQQRILAAQAEIYAQSGIAQGDFAKTSGGLANQQRVLQASLEDTQRKFGESLLPAVSNFVSFANGTAVPRLGTLIDQIGPKFATAIDKAEPKLEGLLDTSVKLAESFANSATDSIPAFISGLGDVAQYVTDLNTVFGDGNVPGSKEYEAAVGRLLKDTATTVAVGFGQVKKSAFTGGVDVGVGLGNGFAQGVRTADGWERGTKDGSTQAAKVAVGIVGFSEPAYTKGGKDLGAFFGDGVAAGIESKKTRVSLSGSHLGAAAKLGTQRTLVINSPSRVGFELGAFYGEGHALGIESKFGRVRNAAVSMAAYMVPAPSLAAVSSAGSAVAPGGGGMPSTLIVVDVDGQLIGRMRVEAASVVQADWALKKAEITAGGELR